MNIKADLHTHTDASIDGRQTLRELLAAAKKRGLDAIAVTDHNYFQALPKEEEILLIPGCEFSTDEGHITGLFLEEAPMVKPMQTAAQAIDEIHRCGGIAVLAHPYQKVFERTVPQGIDAIETANARAPYKYKGANILAYALADENKLPGVGGSDAHSIHEVGNAYTEITAQEKTLPALKAAILRGECRGYCKRETALSKIGLSQFARRRRMGGIKNLCIGLLFLLIYSIKGVFKCR
ncbi:MAG: CehA/McbA family metallohydrolase [Clostridia bacterium]|nr:CehA/McbA family metallohydrolase [Clostridia bacterium]